MKQNYKEVYERWLKSEKIDADTRKELETIKDNEKEIEDRFYKNLEFGTAGLRGVIGAGTNRMNIYTVRKSTQGLANYILAVGEDAQKRGVAISYDCRNFSPEFAIESAKVLAANGIKTYVSDELRPTPVLSFMVRKFNCFAGIMITASHNPAAYNGYKVYGEDGAQLAVEASNIVLGYINDMDIFEDVKTVAEDEAKALGLINMVDEDMISPYYANVLAGIVNKSEIDAAKDLKIVFTPFHGTGFKPVCKTLAKAGFENVFAVSEQCVPDGNFSTVKSPNPEEKEGFYLALDLAEKNGADIIVGTDPDADRVGVFAKDKDGNFAPFTGNQVGIMLEKYILDNVKEKSKDDYVVSTVVSTALARIIAEKSDVKYYEVFTGFKFIAGIIKDHEDNNLPGRYLLGFEESYGYLNGTYARDKDAVSATLMICELAAYCKNRRITMFDYLENIYKEYGYFTEKTISIVMPGVDGMEKMAALMKKTSENPPKQIGDTPVLALRDYNKSIRYDFLTGEESKIDMEKSNVLYFELDGGFFVLRPSGTEPKVKLYFSVKCENIDAGQEKIDLLNKKIQEILL